MADNVNITAGSGTVVATDQVGSDHYQRVKLTDGAADSSTPINIDIGAKANALRVVPANDITDATYLGDIKFGESLPAGTNGIGKLTANSGVDIGDVDVTSVPAPLNVVGGGTEAAALRVTVANDSTGVLTVDGTVTANAGTNLNTSALALEAGGNLADILTSVQILDDWDDSNYCNVNLNIAGTDIAANEGTIDAQTQRVTIATDDDGVAHLATIAGDTTSIDGKITACNTGAVVLATGSAAIGKLAANSGVDIGDVDVISIVPGVAATNLGKAEDAGHTTGDVGVMALSVRFDAGGALAGTDLDYAPLQVDANGALRVTGGGGGTEYTEDVATANPIVGSAVMFERDDALAGLTPAEGDWASMRCSAEGALWVQDFNSDAALALLGTIDADTGAIKTSVELLDNAVDGNFLNVNMNLAGTDAGVGESALDGTELRVTIATDDDSVAHLATIAGDTTSIDGNITACNTGAVVISSGTVTTVSTVTNLSQLGGTAISMDEGTLDAGVQRVSLATDDDAVAHLATIAGDTTAIQTSVEIMDDWDATHDSAASADGPQIMAVYDATKPTAVADGDAVRVLSDEYGRLLAGVEKTAWQEDYDSADATGEGEAVKASAASTIVVVQSYVISSDVEGWIMLQEEDSSQLTGKFWLKAGGGVAITLPDKAPIVLGVDSDLEVICEAAGNVSVSATGYTMPG